MYLLYAQTQRSTHSQFIRISHVKSQPITKKHFAQEYKFLGPTNEHPPFGLCLRRNNDINEALSPSMHVNYIDIQNTKLYRENSTHFPFTFFDISTLKIAKPNQPLSTLLTMQYRVT